MKVNENNTNHDNLKSQTCTPHTILVVEDDKSLADLICKKLQRAEYHTAWVITGSEALTWLTENSCTLVLLDYQLPDMTALQVINSLAAQKYKVPFILMTAHGNEKLAVKMMKLGARDYLVKDQGFRNLLPVVTKQVIEQIETEKKLAEAEEALERSEEKYRMLIDNMPDGIYRSTPSGKFIALNPAYIKMFGYESYEEVMNLNIPRDLYFSPEERENALELLTEDHPEITILRLKKKDGSELWVEDHGRVVHDKNGKKLYYEGVLRDITVRKKAEDALRESEERFRAVTQSAIDAIISADSRGNIITWNLGAQCIFGYTEEEVLGQPLTRLMPEKYQEAHRKGMERFLTTGEKKVIGKTVELPGLRKDGTEFPMEVSLATWQTTSGTFYSGILRDITERKRTTEVLKESEEKFRGLAEHSPNMIFINSKGRIVYANKKCEEILGYTRKEFHDPEFDFFTLIAPESKDIVKESFSRHLKGEEIPPYESTLITKDGKRLDAINTTKLINYEGANAILGTITDITDRKRAEEALAQERHLLNHFIDNVPDAIYFKDQECHFLRVNKAQAARLHLNDPEEALGKSDFDFFSDKDARLAYEEELRVMRTGQISINERKKVFPDGKEGWIQTTKVPMFDQEGKIIGVFGLTRDTTARKNTEEALRRAHTETEQLLAAISSILIGVGADYRITRWNATAESAFGIKSCKILGKPFQKSGIHWDWNMIMQSISESLDNMQPMRLDDIRYLRADGKDGFLGLTITPIVSDAHEKKGFLILAADTTERKTLECQLAQAQKLESIGQLAAGIAHEINTPTQYVGDNARFLQVAFDRLKNVLHINHELLKAAKENAITEELIAEADSVVEDTKMTYIVDEIPIAIQETLDGVDRVANIVRAMKEYAHPDADEMTLTNINKALENTITVARNEWKYVAEMVTDFDPSLPLVPCLPGKLNQVFLNLIVNAVHAIGDVVGDGSAGKGIITVSTGYERDWVEIKISDSGTGIPEEIRPKIFDPFFTSKEVGKGTGQGLSISHNVIVEKHGGSITFETEIGKGTTFIIRLPINPSNQLIGTSNEKTNPVCG